MAETVLWLLLGAAYAACGVFGAVQLVDVVRNGENRWVGALLLSTVVATGAAAFSIAQAWL